MSLMSWSLAGVLALQTASPPSSALAKCEPTDNRCKAELFVRRAEKAESDEQRALYYNVAHRAYLALFDKTGEARHLCEARRLYNKSVAIKNQPAEQRAGFKKLKGDLTSREREAGVRCGPAPKQPQAAAVAGDTPPETRTTPDAAETSTPADTSTEASTNPQVDSAEPSPETPTSSPDASSSTAEAPPDEPKAVHLPDSHQPPRDATPPRPGRNLVIAGGVTLGLGLVLAGVATYTGASLLDTRRQAHALIGTIDGYATDEQLAQDAALRREYERLAPQTLAFALAGGASMVVGAVLLGVGGRRMTRKPSQTALVPVPGGLAFRARF
jgi:hypothetical protein